MLICKPQSIAFFRRHTGYFVGSLLNVGGICTRRTFCVAQLGGCERVQPYLIQEGSGNPVIGIVKVVKPKKPMKKRMVLNPRSAISFHPPDLDDSSVA